MWFSRVLSIPKFFSFRSSLKFLLFWATYIYCILAVPIRTRSLFNKYWSIRWIVPAVFIGALDFVIICASSFTFIRCVELFYVKQASIRARHIKRTQRERLMKSMVFMCWWLQHRTDVEVIFKLKTYHQNISWSK